MFFELSGMLAMHQLAPLQILSEMSLESVTFQIATSVLEHNPLNAQKPNSHTFATVDRCFFPARLHYTVNDLHFQLCHPFDWARSTKCFVCFFIHLFTHAVCSSAIGKNLGLLPKDLSTGGRPGVGVWCSHWPWLSTLGSENNQRPFCTLHCDACCAG